MVNSKKLLSLFLAVVMFVSVFTVMATAYTVGPEVSGDINYKYTVEKVDTVPETEAGSAEYTADNIYAVTAWMQCDQAVTTVTIPFHFDKSLFSPIMLYDGEVTYPYGAGFGVDDYYENMGEGAVYAYSFGDYMNNTGMYKANGTTATTKALAKCIGLGNSNSAGIDVIAELVGADHPLYSKWGAGLPDNTGVMYVNLDVSGKTKSAYFNTISGIETSTEWVQMFTFYFETITDADVTGAEFGVYTEDCYTVDGVTDEYAGYFTAATTAIVGNPNKNVVSNAVVAESGPSYVETTPSIVSDLKWQWKQTDSTYAMRNLATIDGTALDAYLNDEALLANYTATTHQSAKEQLAADLMIDYGFILGVGGTMDKADAACWHQGLDSEETYSTVTPSYLSTSVDSGNYVMSYIITNIPASAGDDVVSVLGYVVLDTDLDGTADEYYYYDTVTTNTLNDLMA